MSKFKRIGYAIMDVMKRFMWLDSETMTVGQTGMFTHQERAEHIAEQYNKFKGQFKPEDFGPDGPPEGEPMDYDWTVVPVYIEEEE